MESKRISLLEIELVLIFLIRNKIIYFCKRKPNHIEEAICISYSQFLFIRLGAERREGLSVYEYTGFCKAGCFGWGCNFC